jgi:hypothetical protein
MCAQWGFGSQMSSDACRRDRRADDAVRNCRPALSGKAQRLSSTGITLHIVRIIKLNEDRMNAAYETKSRQKIDRKTRKASEFLTIAVSKLMLGARRCSLRLAALVAERFKHGQRTERSIFPRLD